MAEELENDFCLLKNGSEHEARLVYVASQGMQAPHPKYPENDPRERLSLCFEVIGKQRVYNNEKLPKLLWVEPFNTFDTLTERGKELPLYQVFVPSADDGTATDWAAQLGKPCSLLIKQSKSGENVYDNIDRVSSIPAKYQADIAPTTIKDMMVSDDCNEQNSAQGAMFGLTSYIWNQRLNKGVTEAASKSVPEGESKPSQPADDPFDSDIPF
jgi:hypothetical protein